MLQPGHRPAGNSLRVLRVERQVHLARFYGAGQVGGGLPNWSLPPPSS